MAGKKHQYSLSLEWTGNLGEGTKDYKSYSRNHALRSDGKPEIPGSSDPTFRGDPSRWNPEELLLASISACHKLWYLHLCSQNNIVVESYQDAPLGTMIEIENGSGEFTEIILRPSVEIAVGGNKELASQLHEEANKMCFIANSVKFPVHHQPEVIIATD